MPDPADKGAADARLEQRIRESWAANATAWTEAVRGGHIESRRLGTDAAIIDAARAWGTARVLDVGCGEGWLARALAPITVLGAGRYEDGWREESFRSFGDTFNSPMPYYFRTVGSWFRELHGAGLEVLECREPLDPETGRPLSLLFVARPR